MSRSKPTTGDRPDPAPLPAVAGDLSEEAIIVIAARLGRAIESIGGSVCTAESCTGGLIARALTETAGSSAWFDRGVVTYSNAAKQDLLGVRAVSLEQHGAVSEVVAAEMALGALRLIAPERSGRPGLALAVTGIAGPGGAVPGKPVGTVCFGWAWHRGEWDAAKGLHSEGFAGERATTTVCFEGDRAAVRRQAAAFALDHAMSLVHRNLNHQPPQA